MSKHISIAVSVVWGILTIIIGSGFIYNHIIIAHAQTSSAPRKTTEDSLGASVHEAESITTIEKKLEYEQSLEEFNPSQVIPTLLHTIKQNTKDEEEDTVDITTPQPIKTTLSFSPYGCPKPDELLMPSYDIVINKEVGIDYYVPSFLVNITGILPTKDNRHICLDETTALYLTDLLDAAREDGQNMTITSGYRSFSTQSELLENSIETHGYQVAITRVAPPGHSEHQLGTTVDLAAATNGYISAGAAFGTSPEYQWMLENAGSFGFVLSYPEGHEEETGYIFEPWHWRFVGVDNVEKFEIREENELLN